MTTAEDTVAESPLPQASCTGKSGTAECTVTFTSGLTSWAVPGGVTSIDVDVYGAEGGTTPHPDGGISGPGGKGGRTSATLTVQPTEVLQVTVGGQGLPGSSPGLSGGFNGGGEAGGALIATGSGGGGASDIRETGYTLADRLVVAGGGGGGGINLAGGEGGKNGNEGESSQAVTKAAGGTEERGGAGAAGNGAGSINNSRCRAEAGSSGKGADGNGCLMQGAGGGGGGYFGGGGGTNGTAGGGGSGFARKGSQNVKFQTGVRSGNGEVIIRYTSPCPAVGSELSLSDPGTHYWTAPACVTAVTVDVYGAQGARIETGFRYLDGLGGHTKAIVPVRPGETLQINVGGRGLPGTSSGSSAGFNGGGEAAWFAGWAGGGGGGASDVRSGGTGLENRVVVAGGGGGYGYDNGEESDGGAGGGQQGGPSRGGLTGGGTQEEGGAGDKTHWWCRPDGNHGEPGRGADGYSCRGSGGGGGGGYYGGGGGTVWSGGGGGSGHVSWKATMLSSDSGVRPGNGKVTLSYSAAAAAPQHQEERELRQAGHFLTFSGLEWMKDFAW